MPEREFDAFVYLLSHDLKNCARALTEVPTWIEEDLSDAGHDLAGTLGRNLGLMKTNARRLDRMLSDLLTYSRIGRLRDVEHVVLSETVEAVLASQSLSEDVVIDVCVSDVALPFGAREMDLLLAALIGNSIKHSRGAPIAVKVEARDAGAAIEISVADNGPGIEERRRAHVLKPMTTLRPRDEVEGSGMGLAIVQKITETSGGWLGWGDGLDGKGVCVTCYLPKPD